MSVVKPVESMNVPPPLNASGRAVVIVWKDLTGE
jgi:hypothetical protein